MYDFEDVIPVVEPAPEEKRQALKVLGMSEDNICCAYCGGEMEEWAPLRPLTEKGKPTGYIMEIHNLVPTCADCKKNKGNRNWRELMLAYAEADSHLVWGKKNIWKRYDRLEAYENWGQARQLDYEKIAGHELWARFVGNCRQLQELEEKLKTDKELIKAQLVKALSAEAAEGKDKAPADRSMRELYAGSFYDRFPTEKLNTYGVTDMSRMFRECLRVKELALSSFDTSKVISMREMFAWCCNLEHIDVSGFDTSSVVDMMEMFCNCRALQELNLSSFNTAEVRSMNGMFCNFASPKYHFPPAGLRILNISGFNTAKVADMHTMFWDCANLERIIGTIDMRGITNEKGCEKMFSGCTALSECRLINVPDFVTPELLGLSREQFAVFTGC